jgi:hypothetical protein
MRSSLLSERLCADHGTTPEAARKRLSRARPPIRSYPVSLLPKREAFFYLQNDRGSDRFWLNLMRDMRETDSAAAAAIDGLMARGGVVAAEEFPVISGAPVKQKKQIPGELILSRLEEARLISRRTMPNVGEATPQTLCAEPLVPLHWGSEGPLGVEVALSRRPTTGGGPTRVLIHEFLLGASFPMLCAPRRPIHRL